ncbi:ArgE/DapE family deacylase [Thermoproteota archaeon]
MSIEEIKKKAWSIIEDKREVVSLCKEMIKRPSDNPPGDTTELAQYLKEYIEKKAGVEVMVYEPREGNPNLVATIEGSSPGPHLVLNGHMDQFPAEVGEPWTVDPYLGEVIDGKLYGRSGGDMKGGLAGLVYSFCLIGEMGLDLPGKLTLMAVSDEETGGKWGTKWLLDNMPELLGDACLNAEPTGLTLRIGEKSIVDIILEVTGKPAHGSVVGYVGENAISKMARLIPEVEKLNNIQGKFTDETKKIMDMTARGFEAMFGAGYPGMSQVLRHVTVNMGVIRGGSKVNIIPGRCEVEVNIRLPLGVTWDDVDEKLEELIGKDDSVKYRFMEDPEVRPPASYTSPEERIAELLKVNAREVTGDEPLWSMTAGATDCRFFRTRGIPSVLFGPKAHKVAAADEYITADELITVAKVHTGTIIDYLNN